MCCFLASMKCFETMGAGAAQPGGVFEKGK